LCEKKILLERERERESELITLKKEADKKFEIAINEKNSLINLRSQKDNVVK
jgi:hypothetical protein